MSNAKHVALQRNRNGQRHLSFLRSGGRETPRGFLPREFVRGVGSPRGEVGPVSRPLTTLTSQLFHDVRRVMGSCFPVGRGSQEHSPVAARANQRSTPGPFLAGLAPDVSRLPRRHSGGRGVEGSNVWLQRDRSEGKCNRDSRVTMARPAQNPDIRRFPDGVGAGRESVVAAG